MEPRHGINHRWEENTGHGDSPQSQFRRVISKKIKKRRKGNKLQFLIDLYKNMSVGQIN